MNDDDEDDHAIVTRPAAATPVKSDPPTGFPAAGEGADSADAGNPGDNIERVEEGPGIPGIEEAGYGYGV
jgi:hypothetical protein